MIINLNSNKSDVVDEKINEKELLAMQEESMDMITEYLDNLIPKMAGMVDELRNNIQEDSWEFLRMMVDGFNWVLEGYNGIDKLINKDGQIVNSEIDAEVKEFGRYFRKQDAEGTADSLENTVIPFLKTVQELIAAYKKNA